MKSIDALFKPFTLNKLALRNRVVMAPMTRSMAPNGVCGPDNIAYYRRRAEYGVGLIISEGTWIDHPAASHRETIPRFFGEDALAGWKQVIDAVHEAGGAMMPQLWHVGMARPANSGFYPALPSVGPSALDLSLANMDLSQGGDLAAQVGSSPMTHAEIDAVVESYARAAENAYKLGFDGIELHGAHGYLIDQFFWDLTNRRTDGYAGSIRNRARFGAEIVAECRRRTAPDFPILFRFSQWKSANYEARLAYTPAELAQ